MRAVIALPFAWLIVCFLLFNKVYSPQYSLWLLPWFALAVPSWWAFVAFELADVGVFVTRFHGFFPVYEPGLYAFQVEAWPDSFRTWAQELSRKGEPGRDVSSELLEGAQLLRAAASQHQHLAAALGWQRLKLGALRAAADKIDDRDLIDRKCLLLAVAGPQVEAAVDRDALLQHVPTCAAVVLRRRHADAGGVAAAVTGIDADRAERDGADMNLVRIRVADRGSHVRRRCRIQARARRTGRDRHRGRRAGLRLPGAASAGRPRRDRDADRRAGDQQRGDGDQSLLLSVCAAENSHVKTSNGARKLRARELRSSPAETQALRPGIRSSF